jgi:hypothetical protein
MLLRGLPQIAIISYTLYFPSAISNTFPKATDQIKCPNKPTNNRHIFVFNMVYKYKSIRLGKQGEKMK